MSLISKILYSWHYLRKNYYQVLHDSCLDNKIKAKLRNKLEYHRKKIDELI
ncbi:hypothetical protein J2S10_005118 [Neobacillus ginsengisoli]|uniref:Uncharacterized protein n=1 Tax=Neobacillus ginsengisoli TaxID=904295 RepID=A0ABT9Y258_9BACI|nr:hypothetical protein [Neobacillus ginsengisoli]